MEVGVYPHFYRQGRKLKSSVRSEVRIQTQDFLAPKSKLFGATSNKSGWLETRMDAAQSAWSFTDADMKSVPTEIWFYFLICLIEMYAFK